MFLKNWQPVISMSTLFGPCLSFGAKLECPVCHHATKVNSGGHQLFGTHTDLKNRIKWEINGLTESRHCPKCGVASVIPNQEADKLEKDAFTRVTEEWIDEQLKAAGVPV